MNLNDVLNYVSKANSREKRIIDLAIKQKPNHVYRHVKGKRKCQDHDVYGAGKRIGATEYISIVCDSKKKVNRIAYEGRYHYAK